MIADALNSYDVVGLAVALGVAALVAARLYYGEQAFTAETRWWGPLRRVAIPIAHQVLTTLDPKGETGVYLTYEIGEEELVATIEADHHDILDDLAEAGYQPQPLASLKRDWEGRREVASWARYHGPKPFDEAPGWLRDRQTHITLFADYDQSPYRTQQTPLTIVTAHTESNPWRPDLWRDHYLGRSLSADRGVETVAEDLDVEPTDRTARAKWARTFQ